jgi:hypothetical protein
MCPVDGDIPGAAASVPDFIRARDAGVVILDPPPDDENTAEIWVWLPDFFRGRGGIMVPPP